MITDQTKGKALIKALPFINKEDKMVPDIIRFINYEMFADDTNESESFIDYYENKCDAHDRDVVDQTLMYLCGWSFNTLKIKAEEKRMFLEEE